MRYILRTERNLNFTSVKSAGGSDIGAVMSIPFEFKVVNLLILRRTVILTVRERGQKCEISKKEEEPVLLDWDGRCHCEPQICILGSVH